MLKKQALGLILMLSNGVSLLASSPNLDDYKQYLAANLPSLQLLMSLNSNDQAGFKNVAIVEYLLASKAGVSYRDLLEADFEKKKGSLQGHLTGTSGSAVAAPAVVSATVDHLSVIIASTGFSEEAIRQRLLNNVVVLERLLAILGQSYSSTIHSHLSDKQKTLEGFGLTVRSTNSLLKILLGNGYTPHQLILIIKKSNETVSTQIKLPRRDPAISLEDEIDNSSSDQRYSILEMIKSLSPEFYNDLAEYDSNKSYKKKNKRDTNLYRRDPKFIGVV